MMLTAAVKIPGDDSGMFHCTPCHNIPKLQKILPANAERAQTNATLHGNVSKHVSSPQDDGLHQGCVNSPAGG